MREHIQAVVDALTGALAPPVHFGVATSTALPWVVVETGYATEVEELPLCGTRTDLDLEVRVKSVAGLPSGALLVGDQARAVLMTGGRPTPLVVTGRIARTTWVRHETDYIDRDVTMAGGVNPAVSVDTYRIQSTPT